MGQGKQANAVDFEKLGAFYLGREHDLAAGETSGVPLLYDAKDLTTHAVCVGMTGSGKTGLCTCLLEEALIDNIPAIAVDVKGDLANLLLGFPQLRAQDFEPWIDPAEAARKGMDVPGLAEKTAGIWKEGLAGWGQDGQRIQRLHDSCDMAVYTPGSESGLQLSILDSFNAPTDELMKDKDAYRERILGAVGGLLGLLGIDADPVQSREHIFLSTLFDAAWSKGENLSIAQLIGKIQNPGFKKVGVLDLDMFYPAKERMELALSLNNLLASPSFAAWMGGESLDIQKLLWTAEGKPRLSILYIAHLSDTERMFFVTMLLNELLSWVRAQQGTSSLRALFYMDEIFGYFPPVSNPPSKKPMLSLLKQARAFGLGIVLATQNPVDLDYKGLSNTGTWMIGRLQTERDKLRVLEGLEGASVAAQGFDKQEMEQTLAGLGSRVFLLHNVHDDKPVVFHTRWALSYLRGPLTRDQVARLMDGRKSGLPTIEENERVATAPAPVSAVEPSAPILEPGVSQGFMPLSGMQESTGKVTYRPVLYSKADLHYVDSRLEIDEWKSIAVLAPLGRASSGNPWDGLEELQAPLILSDSAHPDSAYAEIPPEASQAKSYTTWGKMLESSLYSLRNITLWKCSKLKVPSKPGETKRDFYSRLALAAKEARDIEVAKLHGEYAGRMERLQGKIYSLERKLAEEQSQYSQQKVQSAIDIGTTVLGALFGRKAISATTIDRARSSAHSVGRVGRQKTDVRLAQKELVEARQKVTELELEQMEALEKLKQKFDLAVLDVDEKQLAPRKSDINVSEVTLVWQPWAQGDAGQAYPLFDVK